MTDVFANVAKRIEDLQKQVELLTAERDLAHSVRDAAREASNKDLEARREMAEQLRRCQRALAFAKCCIQSGERWTDTCEDVIGGALK